MTFSVEISNPKIPHEDSTVEIYITPKKLKELANILEHLSNRRISDHEHFFSESWGGHSLSEKKISKDSSLIHHLKITLVE